MFARLHPWEAILRTLCLSTLALFLSISLTPRTVLAQGVSYTTVSKGEFGGSLGTLMRIVPGAQDEIRETTHIRGALMRIDSDMSSTILNAEEGRFTVEEHEGKTFFSYTLEEMMAEMSANLAEVEAEQEEIAAQQEEIQQEEDEPEISFEVKISTEQTGRTMEIGGYPAEQFLMVLEVVPTSQEAVEAAVESGTMAVLTELWVSRDFPGWQELKEAQAKMAEEAMGQTGASDFAGAIQQALASDPRMQEAFEENMEAMKEMDGLAVKTVTSFVTVPPGKDFDSDNVLAMADQPLSEGVGEVVADAAAEEAKEAARGAVRNLTRGILGRRGRQEEEPEEEAQPDPVQTILMRTTSTVEDITTGPLSDDLFKPRPNYREKDPPWKGTDGGTAFGRGRLW